VGHCDYIIFERANLRRYRQLLSFLRRRPSGRTQFSLCFRGRDWQNLGRQIWLIFWADIETLYLLDAATITRAELGMVAILRR